MNHLKTKLILILLFIAACTYGQQQRIVLNINDNWFFRGKEISGDSIKKTVTLPHTWNDYDALHGFDYYRGKGTYAKSITLDKTISGKRLFLRFEGVQSVADVYFNGVHLGQHRGGYSAFIFEVTPYIKTDSANSILVIADNTRYDDILPLGGDFNIYGGIYRSVNMIITDKGCISPLDYASPGVYLTQQKVTTNEAMIESAAVISNGYPVEKTFTVITLVYDNNGNKVSAVQHDDIFQPGETKTIRQPLNIQQPHLWNGRNDPYIYRCVTQTMTGGRITDEVTQPLGLRYFEVDAEKGFFLNGNNIPLHGVSRHQERANSATALTRADHKTDMSFICEIGANAIRLSHYQHDNYFYTLCDSAGMIVWSEIPFVGSLMGGYTDSEAFRENARQQLTELIRQNYNHPSICFWGIYNELSNPKENSPEKFVTELNNLARHEDPTRLTTAASFLSEKNSLNYITSEIAWNKYFGWYYGKPEVLGKWADKVHKEHPTLKIGISEYGAGGNPEQHSENIGRPFPFFHYWHPEEYQAIYHEKSWAEISKRPFIWATFIWNMFDFGVSFRDEGNMPAENNKGMVTYDRKTKKDAFYFYKANWNPEPMVYIANKRFLHRFVNKTHIKVYSNFDKVELFVNGNSMGERSGNNAVFLWDKIILQKGNNTIKAVAQNSVTKMEDMCVWDYKNNSKINFAVWFLRVGIKPFVAILLAAMLILYFKILRHPKRSWKRKAMIFAFSLITLLMVAILVVFIFGKMNYVNIFDYSVF